MGSTGSNRYSFITRNPKLEAAVNKAFDRANLEGEDSDIYNQMYRYKAIRDLSSTQQELVYDYLAARLFGARY